MLALEQKRKVLYTILIAKYVLTTQTYVQHINLTISFK